MNKGCIDEIGWDDRPSNPYKVVDGNFQLWVLIEYGATHSRLPEIVGVYDCEDAMVFDFAKHVEASVAPEAMPMAVAALLRGECIVDGCKFVIWKTSVRSLARFNPVVQAKEGE